MTIKDNQLLIGNKLYLWSSFTGYAIELFPKTQQVKNIVLLMSRTHIIYSFDDSLEHIKMFLLELDNYLPMIGEYHQTFLEKVSRKCKL